MAVPRPRRWPRNLRHTDGYDYDVFERNDRRRGGSGCRRRGKSLGCVRDLSGEVP